MHAARTAALSLALLGLLACQPASGDKSAAAPVTIDDLKTDKDKASYLIGREIGESLKLAGDEIDLDTVFRAARESVDGKESVIDEAQTAQVMQAFGERLQARHLAEAEATKGKNAEEGRAFLAANGSKPGVVTTASGLQYQVLSEGKGAKPKAGDNVRVHYAGTLLDGSTFDSSYDRGAPVEFALSQVVPGWQEGLQLMPVGSKYRLWIPGELGYGEEGTPGGPIGPNQTLVFDVELLDIVK
ncbi:hypothetical protein CSC70_07860 [Pseudoxanthomonas kalamensis DSM 18571]|nr:hypothetical protein CSC70_07860 [Pseudoxanthomonas kalamensis DSM 18571]